MEKVRHHTLLGRRINQDEYKQILDYALKLGFKTLFVQEVNDFKLTPDFDKEKPFD
jgi:putative pyruvate formate lyase activating enzyme